jgi:hypothetical protein
LKESHKKILLELVDQAADKMGNACCTDFPLSDFIPDVEERRALVKAMHEANGDPEEYDPTLTYEIFQGNWWLLGFLTDRALEEL